MWTVTYQKKVGFILFAFGFTAALVAMSLNDAPAIALTTPTPCKPIEVIFARGSGQDLEGGEKKRFFNGLKKWLPSESTNYYELGSTSQGDATYPAVSVDPEKHLDNLMGAAISAGYANDYADSISAGTTELIYYFIDHYHDCHSKFVLAGYSQGAQLVGQFLRILPRKMRDSIEFVALFGDPKLNLPEGRGIDPAACHGESFSEWRRTIGNCNTDDGSLFAREPYLPEDMQDKVGLWCNARDFICGSTKNPSIVDGHKKYADSRGAIDDAIAETFTRLAIHFPEINTLRRSSLQNPAVTEPDVLLLLDIALLNPERYSSTILHVDQIASQVERIGGRFGTKSYPSSCDGGWIGWTNDIPLDYIHSPIDTSTYLHPYDDPSIGCFDIDTIRYQVQDAQESIAWQSSSNRIILLLTYSGTKLTAASYKTSLASESLSPQIFQLILLGQDALNPAYGSLSTDTLSVSPLTDFNLLPTLQENLRAPELSAQLTSTDYKAVPDHTLTFDASNTLTFDDSAILYEWDLDGDGIFERRRHTPVIQYAYADDFDGTVSVRVTTERGLQDTATANVWVGDIHAVPAPAVPHSLTAVWNGETSARLTWQRTGAPVNRWLVSLNDFPLGYVSSDQLFLNVSDLKTNQDNIFTVQGVADDGTTGSPTSITLSPRVRAPANSSESSTTLLPRPTNPDTQRQFEAFTTSPLSSTSLAPQFDTLTSSTATNPFSRMTATASNILTYAIGGILLLALGCLGWRVYRNKTEP